MFKTTSYTLTLIFTLGLSACSSTLPGKDFKEEFRTRISSSGLKHFELIFQRARPEEGVRARQGSRRGRENTSQKDFEKLKKDMVKYAESIITNNQYCSEGFWVLDFDSNSQRRILRGECNDLASQADKTNFPDTISKW